MTACHSDLILKLNSVIVSKWVSHLIWQAYYKLFEKLVSSAHTIDQMKNQSKFDVLLQPPCFTIHSLKFFMIHKMYGCLCITLKEIDLVFVSVIICSIADNLINTSIWRERNKYYSELIRKYFFCEKKLPLIQNLRVKYPSCFKDQITINAVLLSCGSLIKSRAWHMRFYKNT